MDKDVQWDPIEGSRLIYVQDISEQEGGGRQRLYSLLINDFFGLPKLAYIYNDFAAYQLIYKES